jgi:hypothetical protein
MKISRLFKSVSPNYMYQNIHCGFRYKPETKGGNREEEARCLLPYKKNAGKAGSCRQNRCKAIKQLDYEITTEYFFINSFHYYNFNQFVCSERK